MTGNDFLDALIYLVVMGIIFYLILWFVTWVKLPEPFLKVVKVVKVLLGLAVLIFLINFLLGLTSVGPFIHLK